MTNLNILLTKTPFLSAGVSGVICGAAVIAAISASTALAAGSPDTGQKPLPLNIESRFYGTVKNIPDGRIGFWTINNRKILVTRETRITEDYGRALVGAYVEVEGKNTGKSFDAGRIDVKRASRH